ncbi:MAG: PepSY domain-containing protein [Eubacterium sp.]|nr:PepSY domain-containing protein [Eubacterium sp.]
MSGILSQCISNSIHYNTHGCGRLPGDESTAGSSGIKKAAKAAKKAAANTTAKPETAAPQEVTADQALEIALKNAGLTAGQVSFANTHLEYDDDYGMTDYDVEFRVGNKEYSYDINPATGAILNCDVDYDD